jgi:ABC-type dipeptide/oligopeptide/nickel transport system permease subunit
MGRIVELGSLAVMALIVAVFGSPLLGTLHHFRIPALVLLGASTIPIAFAMRSAYQGDPDRVRMNVTKSVLYLAAVLLAFATVAYPTKWLIPSCIVAVVVALVFEGITIAAPGGTTTAKPNE